MGFLAWLAELRSLLEKLEEIGISADEIEIGLSPDAFARMLEIEYFARAAGVATWRDVGGVRFGIKRTL